jgi:aminopeptidase YwaD
MDKIRSVNLENHLVYLCENIGVRLAGSSDESEAADYIATQFKSLDSKVSLETFPVMSRQVTDEKLEIFSQDKWQSFPCSLFSNTPGTDDKWIEAPLVFFESETEHHRKDLSYLRGKAVVHLGCHIESRQMYQRLVEAKPAFLLFVDIRYPGSFPLADGLFPSYVRDHKAVPILNVAYQDAWQWRKNNAQVARVLVCGGMKEGESQNVIAELTGTDPDCGVLYLGAHHDTQANSVGADDNATGVAGLLELARILKPLPRLRTIRLVSFGAEEQLSVGSTEYVRCHRSQLEQEGLLMFNMDSYGSWMGWNKLIINGSKELQEYTKSFFEQNNSYVKIVSDIVPYADHFPFVVAGIPGITLMRPNCTAGRFFHHRHDDDLSRVSTELMANSLKAVGQTIAELAQLEKLPFTKHIPREQTVKIESFWNDLFGGWTT